MEKDIIEPDSQCFMCSYASDTFGMQFLCPKLFAAQLAVIESLEEEIVVTPAFCPFKNRGVVLA